MAAIISQMAANKRARQKGEQFEISFAKFIDILVENNKIASSKGYYRIKFRRLESCLSSRGVDTMRGL